MVQLKTEQWFKPDNAGIIFSALTSKHLINTFRLSVTLKEPVQLDKLQESLKEITPYFPGFQVNLKRGFFWHFFERCKQFPRVELDGQEPCIFFNAKRRGSFPFRIRIYHCRIALEVSHAITDGTGAIEFLNSLTCRYLEKRYQLPINCIEKLSSQQLDPAYWEDSFSKYYKGKFHEPHKEPKAFQLPFPNAKGQHYWITTGYINSQELYKIAKSHGVSVGVYLTSVYLYTLQDLQEELHQSGYGKKKPIRLDFPVNLRTLFPSKTRHNFFLPLHPVIYPALGHYTFEEIIHEVQCLVKLQLTPKYFMPMIGRNVAAAKQQFLKHIPLFIKAPVMRKIYRQNALQATSGSISNLGRVQIGESYQKYIEHYDFIPSYPNSRGVSCGIISYQNVCAITFGKSIQETLVERNFFGFLVRAGCQLKIDSNQAERAS
ncbi:MAG: hypothetical protein MK193_10765 [Lentisphaeria bacterium]|nr:hypothetical protein [Lentisphaeria bacterium]